ncbi:MAG TPA: alpha/beta hydrolase domain-containing protein [Candidatus Eisenbacteria bacterium]|nr:alpha/beta hydrolase domain-containing protein [Candidatus Eisenbacteria bacterium]
MSVRSRRRLVAVVAPVCALLLARAASAQVPTPTVEGPITSPGAIFLQATSFDPAQVGYVQEEYFISGTASAFTNVGPLGLDGKWTVTPGATAPYKTRVVVFRPIDRKKFNGTVIVEWLNVSGGVDASPDWTQGHTALIRDGFAWVGVSAQYVGVEGGPGLVNVISLPLKTANPARYGTLSHPGDSFSYDIFSQAGSLARPAANQRILGDLKVKRVIAAGESQSAFRMVNYIDAIHPIAHLFDGYFVHSRFAFGAPLSEAPQPAINPPGAAQIRSDLDVPVLTLETESDLTFPVVGYFAARQEDSEGFRLWEVAGTSHADWYLTNGTADIGKTPDFAGIGLTSSPVPGIVDCPSAINSGPQHFVVSAAMVALDRWVRTGKPPKSAPRLEVAAGPPPAITRDANGNALGGIRTPQVDVPIAAFTGNQGGSLLCQLFGTTTPFDDAKLAALYPTHKAFIAAYNKAIKRSAKNGWILKPDAKLMKKWAAGSGIGG